MGNVALTFFYLPINIVHSARTIVQTPYWGCKLKLLFLLFLPIASIAPIPAVVLASAFYSVLMPLVVSMGTAFGIIKEESELCFELPIMLAVKKLTEYHAFCSKGCYNFLEQLREPADSGEIVPRDIPCGFLLLSLIQTLCITVVFVLFNAVMIVKVPFLIVGGYLHGLFRCIHFFPKCISEECNHEKPICIYFMGFIFMPIGFVVAIVFWPIGLVLASGAALTGAPLGLALACAVKGYKCNSIASGFAQMTVFMADIDGSTNQLLVILYCRCTSTSELPENFSLEYTCLPKKNPTDYAIQKRGGMGDRNGVGRGGGGGGGTPSATESGGVGGEGVGDEGGGGNVELVTTPSATHGVVRYASNPMGRHQGAGGSDTRPTTGRPMDDVSRRDIEVGTTMPTGESKNNVSSITTSSNNLEEGREESGGLVTQAVEGIGQSASAVGQGLWNVASWGASIVFGTGEEAVVEDNGGATTC